MERGMRQLAVTNVSRKQAMLGADVQLAPGQRVVSLPPTTGPWPPEIAYNNKELDLIISSTLFLEPKPGRDSTLCLYLCTRVTMKSFLSCIWATWRIKKNRKKRQQHKVLLTDGVWASFASTFNYRMQGLVIIGAFVLLQVPALWRGILYNHIVLWKELVACLEKHGSGCCKQITVAAGWWTTFRWLQQSPFVWPHGIWKRGAAWGLSWTHEGCCNASGRVFGSDLELTKEAERGNKEFLNIIIQMYCFLNPRLNSRVATWST